MKVNSISGRVSSEGQITIPIEVRTSLNIEEGDQLEFVMNQEESVQVKVVKKNSPKSVIGKLRVERALPFEIEREIARYSLSKENLEKDLEEENR